MNKIPTIFERDWEGNRALVLNQPVTEAYWVFDGEGVATRKYDGTCCMIAGGTRVTLDSGPASESKTVTAMLGLYRRHEVRPGKATPEGFEAIAQDAATGKVIGWVPVGDGPEDQWHREAYFGLAPLSRLPGTYELVGPKIQGNPEGFTRHVLLRHSDAEVLGAPRSFEALHEFLGVTRPDIEGIVWHHPDGRMAKIKARDLGIKRRHARVD